MSKFNPYSASILLYAELNKQKRLSKFILFDRIKYSPLTYGGHLLRSNINKLAASLDISPNSTRQALSYFKSIGWISKTFTGYQLISWKKIVHPIQPALKKIKFKAHNKKTLIQILAYEKLKILQFQKFSAQNILMSKNWLKKNHRAMSQYVNISVRSITSSLGFKSPSTGSKILHRLQKKRKISITQNISFLCHLAHLKPLLKAIPEHSNSVFIKGKRQVFMRLCNSIKIK